MKRIRNCLAFVVACIMFFSMAACNQEPKTIILDNVTKAKNVILLIGDGMGPNQVMAGEIYKGEKLAMQNFPYTIRVSTNNALDEVTDSAAGSTALATGTRTCNGYVGLSPQEEELTTIVDIATSMGKRTGILTTEELYGATPMGFSGHSISRSNTAELLESAAKNSNVNLFASYTYESEYQDIFSENGYTKIDSVSDISESKQNKIFGAYNIRASAKSMTAGEEVAFDYLVTEALEYLSQDEDGFFLMAEGAHIDHGGHNNNIRYMLEELLAFDDAVNAAVQWAQKHKDTVVIVAADHETGGLYVCHEANKDTLLKEGHGDRYPYSYSWSTTGHTDSDIICFINGANIDFSNYYNLPDMREKNRVCIKNTDIFNIMKSLLQGE